MLRIAIVNDLRMAAEILRRVVSSEPGYEISWIATDGAEAVAKCEQDPPDLILMDLIMPVMDGVEATRRIMRQTPCAVLIVTATVSGNAGKVFEAMGYGALDVVATPVMRPGNEIGGARELLDKISRISRLIQKPDGSKSRQAPDGSSGASHEIPALVAVGASAGGPKALASVVEQLPGDFDGSIVVVQHVDEAFAPRLAEWLGTRARIPVRMAEEGATPAAGTILIAGGSLHLIMAQGRRLRYTPEPRNSAYRPSIDAFFSSAAIHWPYKAMAILLTGMGRDGAQGLLELRRCGWRTIAQDESTSVVYGMPKAAADMGAAAEVLTLPEIPGAIIKFAAREKPRNNRGGI